MTGASARGAREISPWEIGEIVWRSGDRVEIGEIVWRSLEVRREILEP